MTTQEAREVVTGKLPGCNRIEITEAWQALVNSGDIWLMGPKFSATAAYMIDAGILERYPA